MLANHRLLFPVFLLALLVFVTCIGLSTSAGNEPGGKVSDPKLADGLAAWEQVYSVLTSPRCISSTRSHKRSASSSRCVVRMTATSYPQQGNDRHRHFANVIRGPADRGVPALNCVGCHQEQNADSTGVPGGPDWHLAPLSMRWQDTNDRPLSSALVCRAVTDRSRNENMDGPALLRHHQEAALVLWAWSPGRRPDGSMRTSPPLSHTEFVDATRRWVDAGTPCPRGR